MSKLSKVLLTGCVGALLVGACTPASTPTAAPTAVAQPTATVAPATAAPTEAAATDVPTEAAATAMPAGGEVSFMVSGDPLEVKVFEEAIADFEAQNPDITVKLIPVAGNEEDYHARLVSDLVGEAPADVALIDYDAVSAFYTRGAVQAVTDALAKSTVIHAEDFYPVALEAFQSGDKQQMCMPLSAASLVVYYNKNLFDAAKLEYPKTGWTWDEFVTTAKALTKEPEQFGVAIEPELNNLLPFVWQNGGEMLTPDGTAIALNSPEATAGLQFVIDWPNADEIAPNAEEAESEALEGRFEHGELAMVIGNREMTVGFRNITEFDWDVAALPVGKQAANVLKSDGVCVSAKTPHFDMAWKLVEYLNSEAGQTILAKTGRIVPSNMKVAQSDAFLNPEAKPASSQVWLDEIPNIHIVPPLAKWPDLEELANEELEHAYFDTGNAENAVEEITDRGGRYLMP